MKHRTPWLFVIILTVGIPFVTRAIPLRENEYLISDRGQSRRFEVARDEVLVSTRARQRRIEKFAPLASAEAVRQYAADRQRATGEEYQLVLYETGRPRNEFTRRILTKRIHVQLAAGADPRALAASVGAVSRGETPYAPGHFIFETADLGDALTLAQILKTRPGVLVAEPLLARQAQKKFVPNDTYFTQQWHLRNTGQNGGTAGVDVNVTNVWDTYQGNGINIAIVDDGLQWTHPDLTNHYNAALSWDFNWNDADPSPNPANGDFHGTACAGVAAAHGNNSLGVCGAAFNATLIGYRLIAYANTDADEAAAFTRSNNVIHIMSNSWGIPDGYQMIGGPGPLAAAALAQGCAQGRAGKGTIYLFAGGNGRLAGEDANYDGYANSIYTIAVGAISDQGTQADYSEPGACLVVCAPSSSTNRQGITTTDLIGNDGYNASGVTGELSNRDYTQTFGGTSSACPLAAGVCALILQANPNLGWRDLQEILIRSATKNHATDSDWATNSAGFHFNHKYGAGLINAQAAIALATNHWQNLSPQIHISTQTNLSTAIPDNNSNGVTCVFNTTALPALRVEHVTVTVNILHPYRGDLAITLTSPSGMKSRLAEKHDDPNDNYASWTFMSVRHWGETSSGTWSVNIADLAAGDTGTVTSIQLDIYGTTTNAHLSLVTATSAETLGNGNGRLDPGETISETIVLHNAGAASATNITASLTTATPGVTLLQPLAAYSDLASNATGTNLTAYAYRLSKTIPAGATVLFTNIATANGQTFTNTFSHLVGQATPIYSTNSITNSTSVSIPDTGTIYSTLAVALPTNSVLDDVNVFVRINHTYDADLTIALQHPDGTEILLSWWNGSSGDNYGSGSTPTTFDDSAATSITAGTAPFAGVYRPEESLATLNGKSPTGTWRLRVNDDTAGDTGTLLWWGLRILSHTNQYSATLYNTVPVATGASYHIPANLTTNLALIAADSDADPLGYLTNNIPVPNPFPYTPPPGFTGTTNFTFTATDGYATSAPALVTLHIYSTTADSDGDGFTDWQEILAGTNPTNAASALRITEPQPGLVQFDSVTGRTYQIEYKNDLTDPSWLPLVATNGTGAAIQIADPDAATVPRRFYRVRLLP